MREFKIILQIFVNEQQEILYLVLRKKFRFWQLPKLLSFPNDTCIGKIKSKKVGFGLLTAFNLDHKFRFRKQNLITIVTYLYLIISISIDSTRDFIHFTEYTVTRTIYSYIPI